MKTSEFLYQKLPIETIKQQREVAKVKVECARNTLEELLNVDLAKRDWERINAVCNAIAFNEGLIVEADMFLKDL